MCSVACRSRVVGLRGGVSSDASSAWAEGAMGDGFSDDGEDADDEFGDDSNESDGDDDGRECARNEPP